MASGSERSSANHDFPVFVRRCRGTSYLLHPSRIGDASEKPCCAVVYLVLETSSGNYPMLLTTKNRVTPPAKQSIPRLELLSGAILARLVSSVKEALHSQVQNDKTYLRLDSKTGVEGVEEVCSVPC